MVLAMARYFADESVFAGFDGVLVSDFVELESPASDLAVFL
jgi:hypothetical protein